MRRSRLRAAEGLDDLRVELPARLADDLVHRLAPFERGAVGAVARHRVERVRDGEDPRAPSGISFFPSRSG